MGKKSLAQHKPATIMKTTPTTITAEAEAEDKRLLFFSRNSGSHCEL